MIMEGLYKILDGSLLYAQIGIYYPDSTIIKVSDYANTDKIIDGWQWFASREDACIALNYSDDNILI